MNICIKVDMYGEYRR